MRENKIAFGFIVLVIIIIAVAVGLYVYALNTRGELYEVSLNAETQSFVATGKRLSEVTIWMVPTGTNITEADHQHLTSMNLTNDDANNQIWTAHVPVQQFLATSVYVKAFDKSGRVVATKALPYNGATEIYNAFSPFWTPVPKR